MDFSPFRCLNSWFVRVRKLAHDQLREFLRGRYHISPSMLYSIARPLPSKTGYDVPVDGDWVTIAIIAERGPVKVTSVEGSSSHKDGSSSDFKLTGKKYLTMKLVDLGTSTSPSSSSKREVKGDALLNMLLFEATSFSKEPIEGDKTGRFSKKVYKGGSGGAYEACASLREGTVLVILNPRILKPFQVCANVSSQTHS